MPHTMSDNGFPTSNSLSLLERLAAAQSAASDSRKARLLDALMDDTIGLVTDGTDVVDLKLVAAVLSEIRRALAVFRPWSEGPAKITAFGSARTDPHDPVYQLAEEFGRRVAEAGFMIISGAGPGLMSAVVEGAGAEQSFGVGIRLPFEQESSPALLGDPKLIEFKYFFTRKLFFLKEAAGVVLFPGGFGTMDEGFETLTLVQTGKTAMVPIVCLDVPGGTYWGEWDRFVREQLLERGLIGDDDLALYRITHDVDEAVAEFTQFYRVFHSMRKVRDVGILRLHHDIDDAVLETLALEFGDIFDGKPLRRMAPMREEADEPSTLGLVRIRLPFNRRKFGRLRMFVNRLNELGAAE